MKRLIVASMALVASAGFAQTASSAPSPAYMKEDPNETICRIIRETGSRLSRSRICRTRAEWIEWQRELRENTERTQMRRVHDR
jgi:hypothetical protein